MELKEFRCQTKWSMEKCSFNEFQSLMLRMKNIREFSWIFLVEIHREHEDFVDLDRWKDFITKFVHLRQFDCSIKCPSKSSSESPYDFIRIFAKKSSDCSLNIQMDHTYKDEVDFHLL